MHQCLANLQIAALSSDVRRRIIGLLTKAPINVKSVAADMAISRPAVSQHLKILLEAGLVTCSIQGREALYQTNPTALKTLAANIDSLSSNIGPLASHSGKESDSLTVDKTLTTHRKTSNTDNTHGDLRTRTISIVARLVATATVIEKLNSVTAQKYDLQKGESAILTALCYHNDNEGLTPGEIANILVVSPPHLSRRLATLERKHLVQRQTNENDQRSSLIKLTELGRETLLSIVQENLDHNYAAFFELSPDQGESLDQMLRHLLSRLKQHPLTMTNQAQNQ